MSGFESINNCPSQQETPNDLEAVSENSQESIEDDRSLEEIEKETEALVEEAEATAQQLEEAKESINEETDPSKLAEVQNKIIELEKNWEFFKQRALPVLTKFSISLGMFAVAIEPLVKSTQVSEMGSQMLNSSITAGAAIIGVNALLHAGSHLYHKITEVQLKKEEENIRSKMA
tara:strand:+ start:226 stop:750 length:525 start_codon:yes stop_codon:yes gene_type:complete